MTTTTSTTRPAPPTQVPELPADLAAGFRRLKLATVRRLAPELLLTAKTQRWTPEEVLRTLVDAELTARDASNTANRLKAATFPVTKTIDTFDVAASTSTFATTPPFRHPIRSASTTLGTPPRTSKHSASSAIVVAAFSSAAKRTNRTRDQASTAQNTCTPSCTPQSIARVSPGVHTAGRRPR